MAPSEPSLPPAAGGRRDRSRRKLVLAVACAATLIAVVVVISLPFQIHTKGTVAGPRRPARGAFGPAGERRAAGREPPTAATLGRGFPPRGETIDGVDPPLGSGEVEIETRGGDRHRRRRVVERGCRQRERGLQSRRTPPTRKVTFTSSPIAYDPGAAGQGCLFVRRGGRRALVPFAGRRRAVRQVRQGQEGVPRRSRAGAKPARRREVPRRARIVPVLRARRLPEDPGPVLHALAEGAGFRTPPPSFLAPRTRRARTSSTSRSRSTVNPLRRCSTANPFSPTRESTFFASNATEAYPSSKRSSFVQARRRGS